MAKKTESIIRDFVAALEKGDLDGALSFFTEDATWYSSPGTFKGTNEIKEYTTWLIQAVSNMKFIDDGVGILVQGNKALYQHILTGTSDGNAFKVPAICTYEFDGEKCKNHWTVNDRLLIAKQVATGPIARMAITMIINRTEKGLR